MEADEAEPEVLDPEAVPAPVPEEEAPVLVVVAGAPVELAVLAAEVPTTVPVAGVEEPEAALDWSLVKQLVVTPAWMVTGADWAIWPLVSVSWRPMEVPEEMLALQVNEVPVTPEYCWKAVAPGTPPGLIARK